MTKYTYAEKIVNKVRALLTHDNRVTDFIGEPPAVSLDEHFCLRDIVWNYYDKQLIITAQHIRFKQNREGAVLIAFNGFDDLLAL